MTLTYLGPQIGAGDLIVPAAGDALDPLLAEAVGLWRFAAVPSGWAAPDPWPNEGTLGALADLQVVVGDLPGTTVTAEVPATPTKESDGFDIDPQDPENTGSDAGFYTDVDLDFSGDFAVLLDFTPQVAPVVTQMKYLGNYRNQTGDSDGFVMEDITGVAGNEPALYAVAVISSSITPPSPTAGVDYTGVSFEMIAGRQQWVMVADRAHDELRLFRNGTQVSASGLATGSPAPLADTIGDCTSAAELVVGPGQRVHNLAVWTRALTGTEVSTNLPAALGI